MCFIFSASLCSVIHTLSSALSRFWVFYLSLTILIFSNEATVNVLREVLSVTIRQTVPSANSLLDSSILLAVSYSFPTIYSFCLSTSSSFRAKQFLASTLIFLLLSSTCENVFSRFDFTFIVARLDLPVDTTVLIRRMSKIKVWFWTLITK